MNNAEQFAKEYFSWNAAESYPCTYMHQDDIIQLLNRYEEHLLKQRNVSRWKEFDEVKPMDGAYVQMVDIKTAQKFLIRYVDEIVSKDLDLKNYRWKPQPAIG